MRWSASGELVPAAAASVTVLDDGRRLIFDIRKDAAWSNGDALTAQDFVRAFRFALDPANAAPQRELLLAIKNAANALDEKVPVNEIGVRALSAGQLEILLESDAPYFLSILDYPVSFPRHAESEITPELSNGAYTVAEVRYGDFILLRKNERYWDSENVSIPQVRYVHISAEMTEVNLFRAGDLHITSTIPSAISPKLRADYEREFRSIPQLGTYYYALNTTKEPLSDPEIREALVSVLDTNELTAALLHDGQPAAHSIVPPYLWPTTNQSDAPSPTVRDSPVRDANRTLERMGFNASNPISITLAINSGDNHTKIALYVADVWQRSLPVEVTIETSEFRVLLDKQKDKTSWDVIRTSWTADFPDAVNFLAMFTTNSPNNIPGFQNQTYDELIDASFKTNDPAERVSILRLAETELIDANAGLYLYHYVDRRLVSELVRNFRENNLGIYRTQDLDLAN